jgi:hypothetical protein
MYDYSLRELECFVAVAEELSFTRAARRIHLAQPPLSRHVHALEARLGARLFERSARSVSLTAAGRAFLQDTQRALSAPGKPPSAPPAARPHAWNWGSSARSWAPHWSACFRASAMPFRRSN